MSKPFSIYEGLQISGMKGTYIIQQLLGRGGGGSVMKQYAIKQIPIAGKDEGLLVQNMVDQDFKHVVTFREVFQIPNDVANFYIIMEYCDGSSLFDQIYTQKIRFTEQQVASIILQVAQGLQELHALKVIHRDIKPENIMSVKTGSSKMDSLYKICDLGVSKQAERTGTKAVGTSYYIAPEMLTNNPNAYGSQVDIWALGLLLYELIMQKPYFEGKTPLALFQQIESFTSLLTQKLAPFNQAFKDLLGKMITRDAKDRLGTTQVIQQLEQYIKNQKSTKITLAKSVEPAIGYQGSKKPNIQIISSVTSQYGINGPIQQQLQNPLVIDKKSVPFQNGQNQIVKSQIIPQNQNNNQAEKVMLENSSQQQEINMIQKQMFDLLTRFSQLTAKQFNESSSILIEQQNMLNRLRDTQEKIEEQLNKNKTNIQALNSEINLLSGRIDQQKSLNQSQEQQINQLTQTKNQQEAELNELQKKYTQVSIELYTKEKIQLQPASIQQKNVDYNVPTCLPAYLNKGPDINKESTPVKNKEEQQDRVSVIQNTKLDYQQKVQTQSKKIRILNEVQDNQVGQTAYQAEERRMATLRQTQNQKLVKPTSQPLQDSPTKVTSGARKPLGK